MKPAWVFEDIAEAIRERAGLPKTTLMPVRGTNGFAQRINAIVAATGTNPDARRIFHFSHFLTPEELMTRNLWQLDGRPLYTAVNAGTYNLFKVGAAWQGGYITIDPTRVYDTFRLVGTKLYVGSSTSQNHIFWINTTNGAVTRITLPAARTYNRLELFGTWLYLFSTTSSISSHNTIFCINTADDSVHTVTLPGAGRFYLGLARIGNRLFHSSRSTATTDLVWLDITSHPATGHSLANATSTSRNQHFLIAGNKLVISSPQATDYLSVIDCSGTPTVAGEIPGLPNRVHDTSYYALSRWLFIVPSSGNVTEIVRCDMNTNSYWGDCVVPSRKYSFNLGTYCNAFTGKLIGNKLYVGSDASADTIVVINNDGRVAEIKDLPSRAYQIVDDAEASFTNWNAYLNFEAAGMTMPLKVHTVGTTRLFLSSASSSGTSIVYLGITTAFPATVTYPAAGAVVTDTVNQLDGFPSRVYPRFYLNGTTVLYLLSSSSGNTLEMITSLSATPPVRGTAITGLTSRAYNGNPFAWGTGAAARLYLGSPSSATNIPVINLSTNALDTNITSVPSATYTHLYLQNGKIYCGRTGSTTSFLVLGDSVLPTTRFWNGTAWVFGPTYIRPD